jgi:hypothetical protein
MKLITDKKKLFEGIASIGRRGVKLDNDIQRYAASIVNHTEKHGDWTAVPALYEAVKGKGRKVAIKEYFLKFAKIKMVKVKVIDDKGNEKEVEEFRYDKTKVTDLEGAIDTDWTTLEPPPKAMPLDLEKAFIALAKRAAKHTANPVKGDDLNPKLLEVLEKVSPEAFAKVQETKTVKSGKTSKTSKTSKKKAA